MQKQQKHTSPHAKFFEQTFSIKSNATDFIKGIVPQEILQHLSLGKIKKEDISFVDENLKRHFSDVVYSCPVKGNNLVITFLFEHKSYAVKYIYLQLLRYMLCVWSRNESNNEPLSPVIPILVYHGKAKWKKKPFSNYFGKIPGFLKVFIPDFDYLLADLSSMRDEEIESERFSQVALIIACKLMKYIFKEKELKDQINSIFSEKGHFFSKSSSLRVLKVVLLYLMEASDVEHEDIFDALAKISQKAKEVGMTTAEKLRKEGVEQGIEKGIVSAKLEAIKNMLSEGFEWSVIKKISGISQRQYKHMKGKK